MEKHGNKMSVQSGVAMKLTTQIKGDILFSLNIYSFLNMWFWRDS